MTFHIVGLTGGIGSGKSTIASFFREFGAALVDADQLAREVVAVGSLGLAEVAAHFGEGVLTSEGELNRAKLGALVFAEPQERLALNSILHPRIARARDERFEVLSKRDHPYGVYEAALLVEGGDLSGLSALVVAAANEDNQRARVQARDGLDTEAIERRLDAQLPLSKKIEAADYVIWNDGTLAEARDNTRLVHRQLLARFADEGTSR